MILDLDIIIYFCAGNFLTPAEQSAVIAAVSSIMVCALSSLLFFFIGYACGHNRKCRQAIICTTSDTAPQLSQLNPMTLYEEVLPESKPTITNQLELEDNVAYNPLK